MSQILWFMESCRVLTFLTGSSRARKTGIGTESVVLSLNGEKWDMLNIYSQPKALPGKYHPLKNHKSLIY